MTTKTSVRRHAHLTLALGLAIALAPVGGATAGQGKGNGNGNGNGNTSRPPVSTSAPTVTGSAVVGQSVSGSNGSWSGPGLTFAGTWLRCDGSGNACASIGGSSTHQVAAGEVGSTLRYQVTATNGYGSATATSAATAPVTQPAPAPTVTAPSNTAPPTISGTMQVGQTVSASTGSWQGSAPMTYGYSWQRCDSAGATCAATGNTGSSYALASADAGHTLRVDLTAQNTAGTAGSVSAASSVVQSTPAPPPPTPQPAFPIRAAFYYPWFPETWTVNGAHVFYHPTLNYYSSTDTAVQQAHIRALQYAGMNAAISSWWGPGHYTDTRLKQLMQTTVAMGSPLKWAVYYEEEGYGNPTVTQLASDLAYIRDNLATSSAYLKVGGKFVVFVYNADDTTCAVADRWKQANAQIGGAAYVDLKVFLGYKTCASQPSSWHQYGPNAPSDEQPGYSYSISPGWWRADQATPLLARDPARFATNAKAMVASAEPWQLVTTFNEWTEGTAVESAQEWASPSGYGTYLDALHAATGGA